MTALTPEDLQKIYAWVDEIPLSRPKKNITRDFADGVMIAEVVYHYFPRLVELHNYSAANSLTQKCYNWNTMNQKVFRKLGFGVSKSEVDEIVNCVPGAVERVLRNFMLRLSKMKNRNLSSSSGSQENAGGSGNFGGSDGDFARSPVDGNGRPMSAQAASSSQEIQRLRSQCIEKDETIRELRETIDILEIKVQKLEQLVRLKDTKITALTEKLQKK